MHLTGSLAFCVVLLQYIKRMNALCVYVYKKLSFFNSFLKDFSHIIRYTGVVKKTLMRICQNMFMNCLKTSIKCIDKYCISYIIQWYKNKKEQCVNG